jgi:LmbE family N-acetylglucosaminyl deacetylase
MNINTKKSLIIASHPDDDILGCGGILSKFKNTTEFKVIFIAEGSTCRFEDPNCSEAKNEVIKRNSFAINALKYLGVFNYKFYNLPCGKLDHVPQITINKIIEQEIKNFKPDTVFTHSNCDSNKDHHKVYDATIIATRPGCGVNNVLSYEVLSSTEWGFDKVFNPNLFISLSKNNVYDKWNSLKYYLTETKSFPYPRSKKGIETLASYRGLQSGNEYAEAFKLIRGNI